MLSRCELDAPARAAALARAETFAAQGLRVLALARRRLPASCDDRDEVEKGLELVGLVALLDPPRAEVANAGEQCHRAGIRVLVVTGDHGLTALEVARRVGLDVGDDDVFGADEVERMTDAALDRLLAEQRELVFARAAPETKLRIADLLRRRGETVAMTGDGVNDARALRRADIGIAMGRRRHGRRAGGGNDGAHRRQLREYRLRGRGRQARLREHPEVRLLHLRARHPGGRPIPRLRPVGRAHPPCR